MKVDVKDLFRPAFEVRAAVAWAIAFGYILIVGAIYRFPVAAMAGMSLVSLAMVCVRSRQTKQLWDFKLSLAGRAFQLMPFSKIKEAKPKLGDQIWLGWGWRWQPSHTQLAYEVGKKDLKEIYPPQAWLKWKGINRTPANEKGLAWIHGLDKEEDVLIPISALEGHTAIMAVTRSIKTTLYRLLVAQLALRGEPIVIIDPKGDKDLLNIARDAAAASGDPERFIYFHPAFPSKSVRLDALHTWDRESQIASRIKALISADEDNNFVAFCWMTINNIVGCMARIGQRPTIANLLDHTQAPLNAERLCEKVLERFLTERIEGFPDLLAARVRELEAKGGAGKGNGRQQPIASQRLSAMIEFFQAEFSESDQPRDVTGLINAIAANREWFGKMIIAVTPTLTKLVTGDLNKLLSPDYADQEDVRPIYDMRKVIEANKILYIGLDALSDSSVATAVAAMVTADMAGYQGYRYNYEVGTEKPGRVHLLIDEWGDVVCEPVIQLANKAGGAGLLLYLAGQTFSDLVTKMGNNPNLAKRLLGNMNNLIVGATSDRDTLDIIADKFGETVVKQVQVAMSSGAKTEDVGMEFSANNSEGVRDQVAELIPRRLVASLPDLQYYAVVNRGAIYKGRIPALVIDK